MGITPMADIVDYLLNNQPLILFSILTKASFTYAFTLFVIQGRWSPSPEVNDLKHSLGI